MLRNSFKYVNYSDLKKLSSDQSLEKMPYLASGNIIKKWSQRYRGWDQVLRVCEEKSVNSDLL